MIQQKNFNIKNYLAASVKHLFWDVEWKNLDKKDSFFIIERILELGKISDVRWMQSQFSKEEIEEVILNSRFVSEKSYNFWRIYYDIKKQEETLFPASFPNAGWEIAKKITPIVLKTNFKFVSIAEKIVTEEMIKKNNLGNGN